MMVQMLRKGKCYRVETGTTLIPEDSPNYIPNEAVIRHKIAMFGKFEDDAAEFSTEEATMGPPGSPAMPTAAMLDVMKKCREAFPDWKSVVHGVEGPNEDGSYTMYTQQVSGKMTDFQSGKASRHFFITSSIAAVGMAGDPGGPMVASSVLNSAASSSNLPNIAILCLMTASL